ncbi:putative ABC-type Mn2+/Zn2+ transport system [Megalodesulfovibrio gigas DSM 1382 = ATCC 19364]|uniref:Putative ABC-type Mn2+/Zn2+ transport system n=2 Tax=Megalodesulfovibrio gigas TaxID=879 RepID=T2GA97_MEGG1|nr:putative ABC-type Mn2+/Zn2+ transport system [Megalodesulfovibrio gigas DSM 1382 = ATCC 19364]
MDALTQLLLTPWQEGFFVKAMLGGCLIAMVSGVVGCLVVLRRMAFLGDALSHAMIAGVAGGYLFMKLLFGIEAHAPAMLVGSLIAAVLTVMCIGFVSRVARVKEDTAIGVMYTGVFAGGVVLVSVFKHAIHIDLMHFIMGDVLAIATADLWAAAIAASLVTAVIILFFRAFQITSFDPIMAAAIGFPVVLIDYTLTVCVSLVVVSAVSMVGVILVVGLLITPAATAYLLSDRLERMMVLAALFGVSSVVLGLYVSVWLDTAGGGAVMLVCTLQFLLVLVFAPRYGMLARRLRLARMVPQQLAEDILIELLKAEDAPSAPPHLTQDHLAAAIAAHPREQHVRAMPVRTALRRMAGQGLLLLDDGPMRLTEAGRAEATRIRRAHRLWESWLDHLGEPAEALHQKAQALEHVHAPEALDYLDDMLLHPDTDPHGEPIPRNPDRFTADARIPLSLLRPGDCGTVQCSGTACQAANLLPGVCVEVLPRLDGGRTWQVRLPDGSVRTFDHPQADAILLERVTLAEGCGCRGVSA